jgi:hypothetical protein
VFVARRGCEAPLVKPEQAAKLHSMFETWRQAHWQPPQTDQAFAFGFVEPSTWVRLFRETCRAWRLVGQEAHPARITAALLPPPTPAE